MEEGVGQPLDSLAHARVIGYTKLVYQALPLGMQISL